MIITIIFLAICYGYYRFLRCISSAGSVRTVTIIDRYLQR